MKQLLYKLHNHETLERAQAKKILIDLTTGNANSVEIACFLSVFLMRPLTLQELQGFRDAMMELCIQVDLSCPGAIDMVGTGGDGKNTFNISTISSIIVAACGIPVIKHGNYASSSITGSSNILEYFGYRFTTETSVLKKQLETAGLCFLHAPLFHPALKKVSAIRKDLGVRTFFNLLGPLINPASPLKQLLGVSHLQFARMYHYLLQDTDRQYCIIHSMDGYDEISLTGPFKVLSPNRELLLTPEDLGFNTVLPGALEAGNTIKEAAAIFIKLLKGAGSMEQEQVVIVNSGFAIHCAQPGRSLNDCMEQAKEAIRSGMAFKTFKQITEHHEYT